MDAQQGRSVIYKIVGKRLEKFADMKAGSAFYTMAINPVNEQEIVIATTSWSKRATSALFVSTNGGKNFVEKNCLTTHLNGIVSIEFDLPDSNVYLLQKVGGLIMMPISTMFSEASCNGD